MDQIDYPQPAAEPRPPYVQWRRPSRVKRPPNLLTFAEIAEKYGLHRETIRKTVRRHGFKPRSFGVRGGRVHALTLADVRRLVERMKWTPVADAADATATGDTAPTPKSAK